MLIITDNIAVRWRLKEKAEEIGAGPVIRLCEDAIATYYANYLRAECTNRRHLV